MPVAPGWVPLKVLFVTMIMLCVHFSVSVFWQLSSGTLLDPSIRLWLACDRAVLGPGVGPTRVPGDWSPSCPALLAPALLRDHQSPLWSPGHKLTESPGVPRPLRHTPPSCWWTLLLMLGLLMTSTWALNSTLASRPQLKQNRSL